MKCIEAPSTQGPSVTLNLFMMVDKKPPTTLCTKLCVAYTIILAVICIGLLAWYIKSKYLKVYLKNSH